jgi:hypothetical protein
MAATNLFSSRAFFQSSIIFRRAVWQPLLINKLDAYGVSESALKLIKNYLSNRKQCVKIGNIMSEWEDIYKGVPQGSINLLLFLEELFGNHNPIGMLTEKDETPCQRRSQSAHILLFHKILK